MSLRRVSLFAGAVVAVLVCATSAAASRQRDQPLRLALVPLQTAQLGPAGASLGLDYGSGPSYYGEELNFFGINIFTSSNVGPIAGYALDYGDPFTGSTGVMEIRSSVEVYETPAAAAAGLFFERVNDSGYRQFSSPTLPISLKRVRAEPIGGRRFAYLITLAAPNLNPIVRLDEQITSGRYILDLSVTAGSARAAKHAAPRLMHLLKDRLRRVLEGQSVVAQPVQLPSDPQPGQAPGGPDLSTMILQPSDVGQSHAVNLFQEYVPDPPALSTFFMALAPAGSFDTVEQQIGWWPTATEATYAETYQGPLLLGAARFRSATASPVDLSGVTDPATGYIINGDGQSAVVIALTNGQAGEFIFALRKSPVQASEAQSLAQAAANRLDAGLGP